MTPRRVLLALLALGVAVAGLTLYLQADQRSRALSAAVLEAGQALTVEEDPAKALRLAGAALEEHPDHPELHLLRGRAFAARGRHSDALQAFGRAERGLEGAEKRDELRFLTARARLLRYLEAGDRGDFNLAEADLEELAGHDRFGAAAKLLLGMGLARRGDARDSDRARTLLRAGLAAGDAGEWVDVARARQWLDGLGA